jgi:hypothetical protein
MKHPLIQKNLFFLTSDLLGDETNRLIDLVTDKIEARLCTNGIVMGALSDAERQTQLRADLEALAIRVSARDTVIAQVRAAVAEHGFLVDKGSYQEQEPNEERLRPPDFGPEGPSDDDIQRELDKILKKIERPRKPKNNEEYEFKLKTQQTKPL